MAKVVRRPVKKKQKAMWQYPLERKNIKILGIGIAVIIIGYLLMLTGLSEEAATVNGTWNNPFAVDVAPIILVIGYCVIIPYGILKSFGKKEDHSD